MGGSYSKSTKSCANNNFEVSKVSNSLCSSVPSQHKRSINFLNRNARSNVVITTEIREHEDSQSSLNSTLHYNSTHYHPTFHEAPRPHPSNHIPYSRSSHNKSSRCVDPAAHKKHRNSSSTSSSDDYSPSLFSSPLSVEQHCPSSKKDSLNYSLVAQRRYCSPFPSNETSSTVIPPPARPHVADKKKSEERASSRIVYATTSCPTEEDVSDVVSNDFISCVSNSFEHSGAHKTSNCKRNIPARPQPRTTCQDHRINPNRRSDSMESTCSSGDYSRQVQQSHEYKEAPSRGAVKKGNCVDHFKARSQNDMPPSGHRIAEDNESLENEKVNFDQQNEFFERPIRMAYDSSCEEIKRMTINSERSLNDKLSSRNHDVFPHEHEFVYPYDTNPPSTAMMGSKIRICNESSHKPSNALPPGSSAWDPEEVEAGLITPTDDEFNSSFCSQGKAQAVRNVQPDEADSGALKMILVNGHYEELKRQPPLINKNRAFCYKFWVDSSPDTVKAFHNPSDRRIESIGRLSSCRIRLTTDTKRGPNGTLKRQVVVYAPSIHALEKCCFLFDDKFPSFYATGGLKKESAEAGMRTTVRSVI